VAAGFARGWAFCRRPQATRCLLPAAGNVPGELPSPALAGQPELLLAHAAWTHYLGEFASQTDDILRSAGIVKLAAIQEEVRNLAQGQIVFAATEAWRTVYEQLLTSADLAQYRSVAWLKNEDYWQDTPGKKSMQLNFELLQRGTRILRILILDDYFWPPAAALPATDIRRWIDQQYTQGIEIGLVRESEIASETDLLCDLGIYGTRATGMLETDPQCRTTRFTFDFSPEGVRMAETRWNRLSLYAVPYAELLDRAATSA